MSRWARWGGMMLGLAIVLAPVGADQPDGSGPESRGKLRRQFRLRPRPSPAGNGGAGAEL